MRYVEIAVGFGGIALELSGHLYIDIVGFYGLRKRERQRGETASIGEGSLGYERFLIVRTEIEGCLDGDAGNGAASNGVDRANADGVMSGFSDQFRSRGVQLEDSWSCFAHGNNSNQRRRGGRCGLRDGVAQAVPQEISSVDLIGEGGGEWQTGFELRFAGRKRNVLFGFVSNHAGRVDEFEEQMRSDGGVC